jgi:hypothetical protein
MTCNTRSAVRWRGFELDMSGRSWLLIAEIPELGTWRVRPLFRYVMMHRRTQRRELAGVGKPAFLFCCGYRALVSTLGNCAMCHIPEYVMRTIPGYFITVSAIFPSPGGHSSGRPGVRWLGQAVETRRCRKRCRCLRRSSPRDGAVASRGVRDETGLIVVLAVARGEPLVELPSCCRFAIRECADGRGRGSIATAELRVTDKCVFARVEVPPRRSVSGSTRRRQSAGTLNTQRR